MERNPVCRANYLALDMSWHVRNTVVRPLLHYDQYGTGTVLCYRNGNAVCRARQNGTQPSEIRRYSSKIVVTHRQGCFGWYVHNEVVGPTPT